MASLEPEQVCLTCVQSPKFHFLDFQSERDSSTSDVLRKHFWFTDVDFHQAIICLACWDQVNSFHKFYISVEEVHQNRLTSVVVKAEPEVQDKDLNEGNLPFAPTDPIEQTDTGERSDDGEPKDVDEHEHGERMESSDLKWISKEQSQLVDDYIREHVKCICEQCGQECKSFALFVKHCLEEHGNRTPFIECCGKKFHRKTHLFQHVQFLKNPTKFRCEQCQKNFPHNAGLKSHMIHVHEVGKWNGKTEEQRKLEDECIREHVQLTCKACGQESSTFLQFVNHAFEAHGDTSLVVVCCGKKFYTKSRLYDHVRTINNPDTFRCEKCEKTFKGMVALQRHMKQFHEDLKFKCDRCPKIFAMNYQYKAHLKEHSGLKCDHCGIVCKTRKSLTYHTKRKHNESYKFVCEVCSKGFNLESWFLQHKQTHEIPPELQKVQCTVCLQWMRNAESLRRHKKTHSQAKPTIERVQCKICLRWLKNVESLRCHKRIHSTEKKPSETEKMQCKICLRWLKNASSLRGHGRIHSTAKTTCEICGHKSVSLQGYLDHRRRKHSKREPSVP